MSELIKAEGLQRDFLQLSKQHLQLRASDNPEFEKAFVKTFSDLIFSQNDEMLEKLAKTKLASLLNAVFKATEVGASFAKKEVSFIPFEIFKKEKKNGADVKSGTGEYEALVIFDINFQKQQILKLKNCKRFFTAEIHEGVKVVSDLMTGNFAFEGSNDVTKPTIGYYAAFISQDDQKYDLFMSCAEIVDRAKFSPNFKKDNYSKVSGSIHYEKIVVRNLIKIIPRVSEELSSILGYEEVGEYTEYEEVRENRLEEAKKELAAKKEPEKGEEKPFKKVVKVEMQESETAEKAEKTAPEKAAGFDTKFF